MSDSARPHRRQPTRLRHPWDCPGKNTGVGCHFLLQCRKVKSESEVAQSCPTLSDSVDCSLPGSAVCGIFQARVLEWGAIAFSTRGHGRVNKWPNFNIVSQGIGRTEARERDGGTASWWSCQNTHNIYQLSLPSFVGMVHGSLKQLQQ